MDSKKLAHVRQDIPKKNILTSAEIEEIKRTRRESRNSEKQNPEDARVTIENMAPEQIQDTVKKVREGNQINTINEVHETKEPPPKYENVMAEETVVLDAETKELKEKILRKNTPNQIH